MTRAHALALAHAHAHALAPLALCALLLGCGVGSEADGSDGSDPAGSGGASGLPGGGKADSAWAEAKQRCAPPADDDPVLYSDAFKWGYSLDDMAAAFAETYERPDRLLGRAWYDESRDTLVMPIAEGWGGEVLLPARLVDSVRRHIEGALERGYVDFVFFPDMGHSHLFIPQEIWDADYAPYEVAEIGLMYGTLFDDPALKVLYHTAEQLQTLDDDDQLLDDRHLQWRFFTRNLVGDNAGLGALELLHAPEEKANTSRDMAGYRYHGAGFSLSANKDGCFRYDHDGVTRYFDLSMEELPPRPGSGGDMF